MSTSSPDLPTHIAFSDETSYNTGQYAAICLVTLPAEHFEPIEAELGSVIKFAGLTEFGWKNLRSARERFAAKSMIDFGVRNASSRVLRIDVLVWDRPLLNRRMKGARDTGILQRMYYHLFKYVLRQRWPDESTWLLYPDEQNAIHWGEIGAYLSKVDSSLEVELVPFSTRISALVSRRLFRIQRIVPSSSAQSPLIQLSDLFAGLAVYSRRSYETFQQWVANNDPQLPLFDWLVQYETLSPGDEEKCCVLDHLNRCCKKRKLGVSLQTFQGLKTLKPSNPINFWWFEYRN